jgi:AraC-like DNA-binding protein
MSDRLDEMSGRLQGEHAAREQTMSVDALAEAISWNRLSGASFLNSRLRAPWGLRIDAMPGGALHFVSRGSCFLALDGSRPVALAEGEVALLPRGTGHRITSAIGQRPTPVFDAVPDHCIGSGDVFEGGGRGPITELLCASYAFDRGAGQDPILTTLPKLVRVAGDGAMRSTLDLLQREVSEQGPGSISVMNRLLDVLLVQVLREWLRAEDSAASWLRGLRDPAIAKSLTAVHQRPTAAWTLSKLATEAGLSRTVFARRFTSLVGQAPMAYVARRRMAIAARMLLETTASLSEVASSVGYESEYAFNRAFRRRHGVPPGRFRLRARAEG